MNIEIPNEVYCPITGEIMTNPVITPKGHSYEKNAILQWLKTKKTSPLTGEYLSADLLSENRALKSTIDLIIPFIKKQKMKSDNHITQFNNINNLKLNNLFDKIQLNASINDNKLSINIIPPNAMERNSIDLCLCIDISGSMNSEATQLNTDGVRISHGLSLLDIARGAAKAAIKSLNNNDRVSIVSYSNVAKLEQDWIHTNDIGKEILFKKLDRLRPHSSTNLCGGILKCFDQYKSKTCSFERIKSAFILTDGIPNIHPPNGYNEIISNWKDKNPNQHIMIDYFGLGFNLDDLLLKQLSKISNGDYNYIPDSTMLGDIITHAIANSLTTMTIESKIIINLKNSLKIKTVFGDHIISKYNVEEIFIPSIQFGQSKNYTIELVIPDNMSINVLKESISLQFKYKNLKGEIITKKTKIINNDDIFNKINYIRLKFIDTLKECISLLDDNISIDHEHIIGESVKADCSWGRYYLGKITNIIYKDSGNKNNLYDIKFEDGDVRFNVKYSQIKFKNNNKKVLNIINNFRKFINVNKDINNNKYIKDLVFDLDNQIGQALNISNKMDPSNDWYSKWGRKYLLSLIGAHNNQKCNNSKDISVQHFGSSLFGEIYDCADEIFNTLPAPKPSKNIPPPPNTIRLSAAPTYSSYNSSGPCFTGDCIIKLVNNETKLIKNIIKDDLVLVPNEFGTMIGKVLCLIKTKITNGITNIIKFPEGLKITENHPVLFNNKWVHPQKLYKPHLIECKYVYNLVLDSGHVVFINNIKCCTLGHNIQGNIIEHNYYGSNAIINDLKKCPGWNNGLINLTDTQFIRNKNTNWVYSINL